MIQLQQLVDLFNDTEPAKLRTVIRQQARVIERLQLENAQLRHENRRLRRRLADAEYRLLRQAEKDAVLLGALHFAGQYTSRRACQAVGIGSRRWRRAVALLQVSRAHNGRKVEASSVEDFERALRLATERIERQGMDIIQWRMPLCYKR